MDIPKISPELAEETGLHIGDGTMNFYFNKDRIAGSYALRGHIIDDKKHYDKRIKKLYRELYGFDLSLREMPSTGCYGFQKWSNELIYFKHEILKLPLGKKLEIEIPIQFRRNFVEDVIRGIFDIDGTLYLEKRKNGFYPRIIISGISLKLMNQLNNLIKKIGIRSTLYIGRRKEENCWDVGKVAIRGEKMVEKWFKMIQPANPKFLDKYQFYLDNS